MRAQLLLSLVAFADASTTSESSCNAAVSRECNLEVGGINSSEIQSWGWNAEIPPRASRVGKVVESNGLSTEDAGVETTPEHRHLNGGDPNVREWSRKFDDPKVAAYRKFLEENNCIKGLELLSPEDEDFVERAVRLFKRDGFVVVKDVLSAQKLQQMRNVTDGILGAIRSVDPTASAGGGAGGLPHRYSIGGASATRNNFHHQAYCELIDHQILTPVLTRIFESSEYVVAGSGGDVAIPGAVEYQGLHWDDIWPHYPGHMQRAPTPIVTVNFPMQDLTAVNGPIRQIPGTHTSEEAIPSLADEPLWMKLSTLCPVPAGSAIFRDNRAWHGGTPNLSRHRRVMANIEFFAPWLRFSYIDAKSAGIPYELFKNLSPHGQNVARLLPLPEGVHAPGANYYSPRAKEREAARETSVAPNGPVQPTEL